MGIIFQVTRYLTTRSIAFTITASTTIILLAATFGTITLNYTHHNTAYATSNNQLPLPTTPKKNKTNA